MTLIETDRRSDGCATEADRALARRTLPEVRSSPHGARDPAVDPVVWLDHILYAEHQDPLALGRLAAEYDRYARSLAARMARNNEPREDLDQVALEALLLALQRFDPERRLPFPGYATPTILGALRRHYRDRGWLLRVPRVVHEVTTSAYATSERLTVDLGRMPSVTEVAAAMDIDVDDLLSAQEAALARTTESLDAQTIDGMSFANRVGSIDRNLAMVDDRVSLQAALVSVDDLSRRLLGLYYFEGCTQDEIAASLGMSQMQVSRLLAQILRHLRTEMEGA